MLRVRCQRENQEPQGEVRLQMEDDRSLLNERLPDILTKRIQTAEVFIQLRTKASNASYWVDQELRLAAARRASDDAFMLIPLVLDRVTLTGEVTNWVQVDASKVGLTNDILDAVFRLTLGAVSLWPLQHDDPTQFKKAEISKAIGVSGKRVIVDSDGALYAWMDDLVDYFRSSKDLEPVLNQATRRQRTLVKACNAADLVAPFLASEVRHYRDRGWYHDGAPAADVVNRFCRLVLGHEARRLWQLTPLPRKSGFAFLGRQKTTAAHTYGKRFPARPDFDALDEALRGQRLGWDVFYGWGLGPHQTGHKPAFEEIVLDGLNGITPRAIIDVSAIARDADEGRAAIKTNPPPNELITEHMWAIYVLPQLAAYAARHLTGSATEVNVVDAREWLRRFPWRRDHYRAIGLP